MGEGPFPTELFDDDGEKLYHRSRQGVSFPLADALAWIMAARQQILDTLELAARASGEAGARSSAKNAERSAEIKAGGGSR